MATKRWENIGYHNYKKQDWKKKFMHHEKAGHGNLWGWGSDLQKAGYLVPKSQYASRRHGNKKSKYDDRWKWNPDKDLSMQDKWKLFGQYAGKSTADQGWVNFRLKDINEDNFKKVNWMSQFKQRGWYDTALLDPTADFGGTKKKDLWHLYKQWDTEGVPEVETGVDEDDITPTGETAVDDFETQIQNELYQPDTTSDSPDLTIDTGDSNVEQADITNMAGSGVKYNPETSQYEVDPDAATTDVNMPWAPKPGQYTTKGIRRGMFGGRGRVGGRTPSGFFGRRGKRFKKGLTIGGLNTGTAESSLNI